MEEVEYKILQKLDEIYNTQEAHHFVGADKIAEALEMDCQDVSDFLDMMEEDEFVQLTRHGEGCGALLTSKGRLMLKHPDYMQNKGYAIACLNVLEEAVTKDDRIPYNEKKSLVQKIRTLSDDPYMVSIGSGLIVEGLKKVIGL